jgi:hypothetical protein
MTLFSHDTNWLIENIDNFEDCADLSFWDSNNWTEWAIKFEEQFDEETKYLSAHIFPLTSCDYRSSTETGYSVKYLIARCLFVMELIDLETYQFFLNEHNAEFYNH